MNETYGTKWNREETILAYDLYCKMPFSKINKSNNEIIELANLIGRTPSSVGLKMANLASFDPILRKSGRVGMENASKLDKQIFDEFCNDWEKLAYEAEKIRHKYIITENNDFNDAKEIIIPEGKNKLVEAKARVGQDFFRRTVLISYGNKCCITGIDKKELLIASHIKPWKVSDEKTERANPSNGLCLNPLHDKAFDQGYITIDNDFKIIISDKIKQSDMDTETKEWFFSYKNQRITLPEKFLPGKEFIQYHNDVIFKG